MLGPRHRVCVLGIHSLTAVGVLGAGIKDFIEADGAPTSKRGAQAEEEGARAQLMRDKRFVKVTAAILAGAVGKSAVELYGDLEGLTALKVSTAAPAAPARTWQGEGDFRNLLYWIHDPVTCPQSRGKWAKSGRPSRLSPCIELGGL